MTREHDAGPALLKGTNGDTYIVVECKDRVVAWPIITRVDLVEDCSFSLLSRSRPVCRRKVLDCIVTRPWPKKKKSAPAPPFSYWFLIRRLGSQSHHRRSENRFRHLAIQRLQSLPFCGRLTPP